jgi:hypothetical protein
MVVVSSEVATAQATGVKTLGGFDKSLLEGVRTLLIVFFRFWRGLLDLPSVLTAMARAVITLQLTATIGSFSVR